jgi:acyl-CoA reductase-like NAD-dependent aldehyde dehydrogenase
MAVSGEEEAIRLTNDSCYGLSASVWSRDQARSQRVAAALQVGAVNVNTVMVNLFQFTLPQGGWKDSGIGSRLGGADGLLKYCRAQALVSERFTPRTEPMWFPVSPRKSGLLGRANRFLGASDWRRRLGLNGR